MPLLLVSRSNGGTLSMERLALKAPGTLREVRMILSAAVLDILANLGRLEKTFYNGNKREKELKKWCDNAHLLMRNTRVTWIQSISQIDIIAKRALTEAKIDLAAPVSRLRESIDKTSQFVPSKFEEEKLLGNLENILKYLQMYCHSVYNPPEDPPIKVAADYETRTQQWTADIRRFIAHVRQLQEKFLKGTLFLEEMTQGSREFAMKTGCDDVVCMFIFNDAAECVRAACQTIQQWINFANNYGDFLSIELKDLCALREALQIERRSRQDTYNVSRYRQSVQQNVCARLDSELEATSLKEAELLVAEELLLSQASDLQLDRDINAFRLNELHRKTADFNKDLYTEKLDEITHTLRDLDDKLPFVYKEVDVVKAKLNRIEEKRKLALSSWMDLRTTKATALECMKSYQASERSYSTACKSIELIRQIMLYLSTDGVPQKICLGLPRKHNENVKISRIDIASISDSKMDEAINFLVHNLGSRWTEFYHHLAFYPNRGTKTIENDIIAIQKECVRETSEGTVRRCLEYWQRHHTRVKIADMREALARSGCEKQLVQEFDNLVDMRPPPPPEEEHFPASMDKALIPYYRQICRYDRMRAAHQHGYRQPAS